MRNRQNLPPEARHLIRAQAGTISTGQLIGSGLSPRVVKRMVQGWERVAKGIYLTTPPHWESALWAGLLRGGAKAVVGGLAACHLEQALRDAPLDITVWVPERRADFSVGTWRIRFRRGRREGYRTPKRTRIHTSLLDVAASHDELDTVATITSALARGVAEPRRLLTALGERPRQRHRETIRALCGPAAKGVHSLIEWLFIHDVIRAHGLPEPDLQVQKAAGIVDEHYHRFATIIELDGMRDHSDWSKDMYRDNEHLLEDLSVTLRYGMNAALRWPCAASEQVARRFRSRGWLGQPKPCARCAAA